jgi:cyclic beta-1,2-glucan synthetase
MDWKEFVETLSLVEEILRSDPAGVYARWIFQPAIAIAIRSSSWPGTANSRKRMSRGAPSNWPRTAPGKKGASDRTAHVGFYLIDKGQSALGRLAKVRWPWRTIIERSIHRFPLTFYAGGIGALTLLATFGFDAAGPALEVPGMETHFLHPVFLLCASQLAVALMNWLSTLLVKPRLLPRLDFSAGIAADCRTMVVVPTMLTSLEGVDRLIETLEIHHLANRDQRLHFALLTDFRDAPEEILPGDQALLNGRGPESRC